MIFSRWSYSKIFIFLLATLVVPFMMFQNQDESSDQVVWFLKPISYVSSQIQKTYSGFRQEIVSTISLYTYLVRVGKDNRFLESENKKLLIENQILEELKTENKRLLDLFNFQQKPSMKLKLAQVIAKDLLSTRNSLVINKGSLDGIKISMPVIVSAGVVGYIARVESHSAYVLLITDSHANADAMVQRSRMRLLLEGKNNHLLESSYFQGDLDIKEKDLIVSSGLDKILPKGLPLGRVVELISNKYKDPVIKVKPEVEFSKLEEVFILMNSFTKGQEEKKKDEKETP